MTGAEIASLSVDRLLDSFVPSNFKEVVFFEITLL
jgi:hypothetical protein